MKQHYHKVLLDLEHFNHWCDRANITVEFQFKYFLVVRPGVRGTLISFGWVCAVHGLKPLPCLRIR